MLLSFANDAAEAGAFVTATLKASGWVCQRAGESAPASLGVEPTALLLVLSAGASQSPQVLRDVERAASLDRRIIPLRTDTAPLSRALEYYAGGIGVADATRVGLPAATEQALGALERAQVTAELGNADWDEFLTYGRPPRFRPQTGFRRWLMAGLGMTLVLGVAGSLADVAALLSPVPDYRLVRWCSNLSGGVSGFVVWVAALWFYRAHRNLVALGDIGLRFRTSGLVLRLFVPPFNFAGSASVIREILTRPGTRHLFPTYEAFFAWCWPMLFLSLWVHTYNTNAAPPRADTVRLLWAELGTNLVQLFTTPMVMLLMGRIARAQAALRDRLTMAAVPQTWAGDSGPRYVLVSSAEEDRETARVICEALDSPGMPCRLATAGESAGSGDIGQFSAMILVVSVKLANAERAFRDYESAFQNKVAILPFRLDRSSPPEKFDLIRPVHWTGDEVTSFDAQIERIKAAVLQIPAKPIASLQPTPAATAPVPQPVLGRSFYELAFFVVAGLYAAAAGLCCILDLLGIGAASGMMSLFLAFSEQLSRRQATLRAVLGVACAAVYLLWSARQPAARTSRRWLWLIVFLGAAAAGFAVRYAWDFMFRIRFHLVWLMPHSASIQASSAWDLLCSAASLAALQHGLLAASAASAARRAAALDRTRAANLRQRPVYEPLRFARQELLTRWIGRVGLVTVGFAALLAASVATGTGPDLKQQFSTSWAVHLVLVPSPVTVLFLIWLVSAFRNVAALGFDGGTFTSRSALAGLAIPFINLCLAVPILDELLRRSARASSTPPRGWLIRCWFVSVTVYWCALWVRLGATIPADQTRIAVTDAAVVTCWAAACVFTRLLVAEVNAQQMAIWSARSGSA